MEGGGGNRWSNVQGDPGEVSSVEWRSQLHSDARQRIVNKIMDTLKRHLPINGAEGISELNKIAVRFEEKIYAAATSQSDYLRKISMKMLTMEQKTQNGVTANPIASGSSIPSQGTADSASVDSTAQTGPVGIDWQEEVYQKIKSLKEMYSADLQDMSQRIGLKLQQESLALPLKQSEQFEGMKKLKSVIERMLQLLHFPKSSIQLGLKDKLPVYEKQIIHILATRGRRSGPSQLLGQLVENLTERGFSQGCVD